MVVHGCSWLFMVVYGCLWLFIVVYGCLLLFMVVYPVDELEQEMFSHKTEDCISFTWPLWRIAKWVHVCP